MSEIVLDKSPLAPATRPVRIHYREWGAGTPLVFLHGGWGYQIYPFDSQVEAFADRYRILAPDRSGYGRSTRTDHLPSHFHELAAVETASFLDALEVDRPILWGHSDGAVIAAIMGLADPERFRALVLEAFHFDRAKPASREFFSGIAFQPESLGQRVCGILAQEHGEDCWRAVLEREGRAWLKIAEESQDPSKDLYGERLSELRVPAIFIHGAGDPRTEPGEMATVHSLLPRARIGMIEGAGHCPHSERDYADECNRLAAEFLDPLR